MYSLLVAKVDQGIFVLYCLSDQNLKMLKLCFLSIASLLLFPLDPGLPFLLVVSPLQKSFLFPSIPDAC